MKRLLLFILIFLFAVSGVHAQSPFTPPKNLEEISNATVYQGITDSDALLKNLSFTDIANHWGRDSILRMAAISVMRGYGNSLFRPDGLVTKEEALVAIMRAAGMEEEAQKEKENGVTIIPNNPNFIDPWAEGYIKLAVNKGIITINDAVNTKWTDVAERQEAAFWIVKALGISPVYGKDQKYIYNFNDWRQLKLEYIPYVESALKEGIMKGTGNKIFSPIGALTRAQLATMLDNIKDRIKDKLGVEFKKGTVERIDQEYFGSNLSNRKMILVSKPDQTFDRLIIEEDGNGVALKDFVLNRNGSITKGNSLKEGDDIYYIVDKNSRVIYAELSPILKQRLSGYVKNMDGQNGKLTFGDDYTYYTFDLIPLTKVYVNGREASLEDIKFGQEVTVDVVDGKISQVLISYDVDNPGYVPEGSFAVYGQFIDYDGQKIRLFRNGNVEEYNIYSTTKIYKGGLPLKPSQLERGDNIRIYVDGIYSKDVTRIDVEGKESTYNLYKGTISLADPYLNLMSLNNVKKLNQNRWEDYKDQMTLSLSGEYEVFYAGEFLRDGDLKRITGLNAYVLTENSYGAEKVARVYVPLGFERDYFGDADYNRGENSLNISGNSLKLNEGSIVLMNGKPVNPVVLGDSVQAFMVSEKQGNTQNLALAVLFEKPSVPFKFYKGRIYDIKTNSYVLKYYSELDDNEWQYNSDSTVELDVNSDTTIIDNTGSDPKVLSVADFLNQRYYSTNKFYSYRAYVITDGSETLGINILPQDYSDRITIARIKEMDLENNTITLTDARDWSSFYQNWQPNNSLDYINIKKALIIKNGNYVTPDQLSENDELYIIRESNNALLIYAK